MSKSPPEERATYVVMILAGCPALVAALLTGGRIGAGVTISFLMFVAGLTGLVSSTWRRRERSVPPAHEVRRTSRSQTR
jgi:hypothetical protein